MSLGYFILKLILPDILSRTAVWWLMSLDIALVGSNTEFSPAILRAFLVIPAHTVVLFAASWSTTQIALSTSSPSSHQELV